MSQIQRRFIADNAVNGAKIRLDNNEAVRARNAAGTSDVPLFKLNAGDEFEILRQPRAADALPLPNQPKHYVTVEYLQDYIVGKTDTKDSVNVLATVNIPLTGTAPLVIDGETAAQGPMGRPYRVGLIEQDDAEDNGIYVYTESGGNYTLTRADDFNEDSEVTKGVNFRVVDGTDFGGYEVLLTTDDPITLGVTALTFVAYPSTERLEAGDMLVRVGNVFSVDLAPLSGLESTNPGQPNGQLRVKTDTAALEKDQTTRRDATTGAVVAKKPRKFTATLTSTDITNGYVDLPDVAAQDSVRLAVAGAGDQFEGTDYTVNYTGGTSSKTRVTFAGGLATGGVSALMSGDSIVVYYTSF